MLEVSVGDIKTAINKLQEFYKDRGLVVITTDEEVSLGTHPDTSALIEKIRKEELSRDLGRAGLETLAIILYKGPISRREIDFIRGVNSSFIIRNLLIRGLIERAETLVGERSYSYKATLELLRYLGISKKEDLPQYKEAFKKMEEFVASQTQDANE